MEILEIIKQRRTLKPVCFNGKIINSEIFNQILEAANWAPNHGQNEPWRLFIFKDKGLSHFGQFHADLYKKETETTVFLQKKFDVILNNTALCSHLLVVGISVGSNSNIPFIEEVCATACAVQNMLLVAQSFGISSYWGTGGMTYSNSMKKAMGLEDKDQIIGLIYFGYTDENPIKGIRNSPIDSKCIVNKELF